MIETYWPIRWTFSSALARTKLPQVISLIPLLGYAVLWSDQFHDQIMRFETLAPSLWFSPTDRIRCLYIGSLLVLGGVVLLFLFCPVQIRALKNSTEYADHTFRSVDVHELEVAYEKILSITTTAGPADRLPPFLGTVDAKQLATGLNLISNPDHRRDTLQYQGNRQTMATAALQAHYSLLDRSRPFAAGATFILLFTGAIIFLLPSVEVFLMVVKQTVAFKTPA
ncbi:hypothetical protein EVB88_017 [Rhizobium phage RHph_N28_2]|nr:hypothetical protein EVB88_017 [Rhizobium phage RHph_N28_2]